MRKARRGDWNGLSRGFKEREIVTEQFFEFLAGIKLTEYVLTYHGYTHADLREFLRRLTLTAGGLVAGHYPPVVALVDPEILDFICTILRRPD